MIIEIVEHPGNANLRANNKVRVARRANAQPLITDQMLVLADGKSVGWLHNHPPLKPGVAMSRIVDAETLEEINREVERYLGQSVPIGTQEPDEDTDDDDEEGEGDES